MFCMGGNGGGIGATAACLPLPFFAIRSSISSTSSSRFASTKRNQKHRNLQRRGRRIIPPTNNKTINQIGADQLSLNSTPDEPDTDVALGLSTIDPVRILTNSADEDEERGESEILTTGD